MGEKKFENVNDSSKETRYLIYIFAIIFILFVLAQMCVVIKNKTDKHYRIMEQALKNCGLKAGPNDYYFIDRKTFIYCFVDSGYDIKGIAESFSEYMDNNCDFFYKEGYHVEIRFVHKINHNHEETVFKLSNYNYDDSKILKTFEIGEITSYAYEYLSNKYCDKKINCVKTLYMSTPICKNLLSCFENVETITISCTKRTINPEEVVKQAEEEVKKLFPKAEIISYIT